MSALFLFQTQTLKVFFHLPGSKKYMEGLVQYSIECL